MSITLSFAKPISIDKNTSFQEILSHSDIYIDKTQALNIKDIIKEDTKFAPNDNLHLGYGYSPKFAVWIKFSLTNNSKEAIDKIIEYDNALTTRVEFFDIKDSYTPKVDGLLNINATRKTINPIFPIHLKSGETRTFYVRASSYITTLIIKLNLWEPYTFFNTEFEQQSFMFLFFGAMSILGIYNLFIYFFTKDVSYLYYFLYVLGIVMHHLMYIGIGPVYIFNQDQILVITHNASLITAFPILALALFIKSFLNIKQYPIINKILNFFILIFTILVISFVFTNFFNAYRSYLTVLFLSYLLYITIYSFIKKNKQASFILLGWFAIFLAVLFMFLSSAGIFNIHLYIPYYIENSLLFEATIFSIALANRIKSLQEDKEKANLMLIQQKENEKQRLSKQVEEKTQHLKEKTQDLENALGANQLLLQELHHRVKNNMQTMISLIRLQRNKLDNEELKEVLTTVQNRINAMSHAHELLYQQHNLTQINAYEYFDLLIEDIRQSFTSNININFEIKANLPIQQAIYCGLIVNELVTNSFKYAFPNKEGNIFITLVQQPSSYYLHVKDDGIGYDTSKHHNSLGTSLVKMLAQRQLKGEISTDGTNGVNVVITWSKNEKDKNSDS